MRCAGIHSFKACLNGSGLCWHSGTLRRSDDPAQAHVGAQNALTWSTIASSLSSVFFGFAWGRVFGLAVLVRVLRRQRAFVLTFIWLRLMERSFRFGCGLLSVLVLR